MYKVVIADDEVLIRMYIREILENNGFEVVGDQRMDWTPSRSASRSIRIL